MAGSRARDAGLHRAGRIRRRPRHGDDDDRGHDNDNCELRPGIQRLPRHRSALLPRLGCTKNAIGNQVLIYTRTAGPRHANLGPRLAAGLDPPLGAGNIVQNSLKSWLEQEGIEVHWTEDVTRLTNLHRYKAVIFASTSRDTLFAHGRADRSGARDEHRDQRASRRGQDGAAAVHPRRRRIRRHPQRVRHRVQLAVVRGPARQRQLLRPRRQPGRHGQHRRAQTIRRPTGCRRSGRSATSGTTSSPSRRA